MFSEFSSVRIECSESLKRMTPHIVPSTFLRHRLCNTDHKTFSFLSFSLSLSLATASRLHAFFAFYFKSKIIIKKRAIEKSVILWSGSLMSVVSSSTEVFLSNFFRLKTCVCIRLGQVAKLRDACAEWRMSCAFSTGNYGKNVWTGLSVTS